MVAKMSRMAAYTVTCSIFGQRFAFATIIIGQVQLKIRRQLGDFGHRINDLITQVDSTGRTWTGLFSAKRVVTLGDLTASL